MVRCPAPRNECDRVSFVHQYVFKEKVKKKSTLSSGSRRMTAELESRYKTASEQQIKYKSTFASETQLGMASLDFFRIAKRDTLNSCVLE